MTDRSRFSRLDPELTGGGTRRADPPQPTRRARVVEVVLFSLFGLLLLLGGLAAWATFSPRWREVPNRVAEGQEHDRINVLLIGIGGKTHIGGGKDLADAIILASFRPSTREVAMISIPRDLYVRIGSYGKHRINEAHRIGNQTAYPGRGPKLLMDTVSETVGVPVHAFVRVDFAAFEKVVDQIGGVDVYVERSFHDFLFDDGFEKGWNHLDGERALLYARYRYVNDVREGTIFAREERQQQVIQAVQKKLRNEDGAALRLIRAGKTLSDHTETNLTTPQMVWFYRTFGKVDPASVKTVSLQPWVEIYEHRSLAGAAEAVRPRGGDFGELQGVVKNVFSAEPAKISDLTLN